MIATQIHPSISLPSMPINAPSQSASHEMRARLYSTHRAASHHYPHSSPAAGNPNRHSLTPSRRPLRSSPLAGPALHSEGGIADELEENEGYQRVKPSRVLSSPEITRYQPPQTAAPPVPSGDVNSGKAPRKRASFLNFRRKSLAADIVHEQPPTPAVPQWALEEEHLIVRSASSSSMDSQPAIFVPETSASPGRRSTSPKNIPGISPEAVSRPPNFPRALSRDSTTVSENWMTENTYETTPRFSRLSMASVVMPVSANKANRLSRTSSRTSVSSSTSERARTQRNSFLAHFPTLPVPLANNINRSYSTPSLPLTRRRSSTDSDVSKAYSTVDGEILPQSPTKPGHGPPRDRSDSTAGTGRSRRESLANLRWGARNLSIKLSHSAHAKGMSFLSFNSVDSEDDRKSVTIPIETLPAVPIANKADQPSDTSTKSKKREGLRRLWRTISGRK